MSFAKLSWPLAWDPGFAAPAASSDALVSGAALGAGTGVLAADVASRAGSLGVAAPVLLAEAAELEAAVLLRGVLAAMLAAAAGAVVVAGLSVASASELSLDPPQAATARTKPKQLPETMRDPRCSTPKN